MRRCRTSESEEREEIEEWLDLCKRRTTCVKSVSIVEKVAILNSCKLVSAKFSAFSQRNMRRQY